MEHPLLRSCVSGLLAGSLVGFATTPLDTLRAVKQDHLLDCTVARSYRSIAHDLGGAGLFKGVLPRMLSCSLAIILMDQGRKILNKE